MRMGSRWFPVISVCLASALVLTLYGCGGSAPQPPSVQTPAAADTSVPVVEASIEVPPVAEQTASSVAEPSTPEELTLLMESVIDELAEQPILTWARDAGGLNHCDRLSVYADGHVEAVVCRSKAADPMVSGSLADEQLALVLAWTTEYASFTRRETDISNAVRTTMLHGIGENVPALEAKVEIAAFAAGVFLTMTAPR